MRSAILHGSEPLYLREKEMAIQLNVFTKGHLCQNVFCLMNATDISCFLSHSPHKISNQCIAQGILESIQQKNTGLVQPLHHLGAKCVFLEIFVVRVKNLYFH